MIKIYKYIINNYKQRLVIEGCERLLSAENQNGNIVVYAQVNSNLTNRSIFDFLVVGTGEEINEKITDYKFLGTINQYDRGLMWHVFYK